MNPRTLEARAVLLPDELRAQLPRLYAQQNNKDPTVAAKFFTPDSHWTWFITEGQQEEDDFIFFGYVIGFEEEWGYSSLNELQAARGPLGLPIERCQRSCEPVLFWTPPTGFWGQQHRRRRFFDFFCARVTRANASKFFLVLRPFGLREDLYNRLFGVLTINP